MSRGDWTASTNLFVNLGESLVDKTVGVIGLGRIGLALVQRLLPFMQRCSDLMSRESLITNADHRH